MGSGSRAVKPQLVLVTCCISILMVTLDMSVLNVALPSIQRELHASISEAQWTIDAYTLVLASLLLLAGSTADRLGRKKIFQIGLCTFAVGSLLCSLAPNLPLLILFRCIQGVGGSMLNPVALSIISNTFSNGVQRARAIGVWSGVVGISTAAGPIIGGLLVDTIGWRSIFWINVPIAILGLIGTLVFVPESRASVARRVDPVGQIVMIVFLAALVYGIIEAPNNGWGSPLIIGCIVASGLALVVLIVYELHRDAPMIQLRFFRSAPFSGASFIAIAAFLCMGGFLFTNTLYLQEVRGLSAINAGLLLIPMAGMMLVLGPLSGRLVGALGPRLSLVCGGGGLAVSGLLFALWGSDLAVWQLILGYAVVGVGLGFINPAITNTAISGMPRSQSGVASAVTSTSRQVGQSLGVAIMGTIIAHAVGSGVPIARNVEGFMQAAHTSWLLIALLGVGIAGVAIVTTSAWGDRTADAFRALIAAADEPA